MLRSTIYGVALIQNNQNYGTDGVPLQSPALGTFPRKHSHRWTCTYFFRKKGWTCTYHAGLNFFTRDRSASSVVSLLPVGDRCRRGRCNHRLTLLQPARRAAAIASYCAALRRPSWRLGLPLALVFSLIVLIWSVGLPDCPWEELGWMNRLHPTPEIDVDMLSSFFPRNCKGNGCWGSTFMRIQPTPFPLPLHLWIAICKLWSSSQLCLQSCACENVTMVAILHLFPSATK
jgi:hypothetical protein